MRDRTCCDCHLSDDAQNRHLSLDCAPCHNLNDWDLWQFKHNTQSKCRLDGAHEALACLACQGEPVKDKIRMGKTCASCHRKDDIHRGEFGRNCERCHLTKAFNQIRVSH